MWRAKGEGDGRGAGRRLKGLQKRFDSSSTRLKKKSGGRRKWKKKESDPLCAGIGPSTGSLSKKMERL